MTQNDPNRREVATRNTGWAKSIAGWLASTGLTPNQISVAGVGFALIGALATLAAGSAFAGLVRPWWVLALACIQLRLLCNMLDGMVAVEGGKQTAGGVVYNDLPDRLADILLLVPAGYAIAALPGAIPLGWLAALGALFTAYVRLLGGSCGLAQSFAGPMAKPQRMAALTAAYLLQVIGGGAGWADWLLYAALLIIVAGTLVTAWRRTAAILKGLDAHDPA